MITIGKDGNQPFEITQSGVSRTHATIDITEDGVWMLTDKHSTNGTYIREADGTFRRISSVKITPMTFIRLGPETVHGCSFYAKRVFGDNKNYEYFEEFEYLSKIDRQYEERISVLEKKASKIKLLLPSASMVGAFGILMLLPLDMGMSAMVIRFVLSSIISAIITFLFNPTKKVKLLKAERERFHDCPNPKCNHKLKTSDIDAMLCPKCKAK